MATRSLPERVSALEETVSGLQRLPQEVAAFRSEFDTFRTDVNAFRSEFDTFRTDVNNRFERLEQHVRDENDRLYSRMRSLHEDLVSRIKTLGEGREAGGTAPRPRRPKPKR